MCRSEKARAGVRRTALSLPFRVILPIITVIALVTCLYHASAPSPERARGYPAFEVAALNYCESDAEAETLELSARSAILIDAQSGSVLYEHNARERLPMASTTKIMTALVAAEESPLDKTVTVSKEAVGIEGSSVYLYEGERLSMEALLYALLLESANDAAVAIAMEVGGSVEEFAALMNQRARSLGLTDTSFENPHGLDSDGHYTTASELAAITREAISNPLLSEIFSTAKRSFPMTDGDGTRLLINHNKLLRIYDGATGVKTGYTKKSGRCLVSAAERDGVRLIAVTLNAPDDWEDHRKMLDFGFDNYEYVTLCERMGFSEPLPVEGGAEQYVTVTNRYDVGVTLPKKRGEISCTVELPRFEFAPIERGEGLGRLIFSLDGRVVATAELSAAYDICAAQTGKSIFDRIADIFKN